VRVLARDVACVIPTRGNVDMHPVRKTVRQMGEVVVWDNSLLFDYRVYARYAAIHQTTASVIVTQDDDALLPRRSWRALLEAYEPGKVVCNVPDKFRQRYTDSGMVGFGAIFDRDLPALAFSRYVAEGGDMTHWEFLRECDIVFTMLTPIVMLDLPYVDREFANDEDRLWRQPGHFEGRDSMRVFCRQIRDRAVA